MKEILKQISELSIKSNDSTFTDEQKSSKWLGTAPASEEEIKAAENTLGVQFPGDYKDFLLVTNGFFTPADSTEPTFERVDKIDYLANVDSFLLELFSRIELADVGKELSKSIVVGGINDEQYFLLIPPNSTNKDWRYWKFASWIPGEEPYEGLKDYFSNVLEFIKSWDSES